MSATRPLTYVEPAAGSPVPANAVLVSMGSNGATGKWMSVPTVELIDPSGTNTVSSVATAMNSLMWNLGQSKMLAVEPRIWFGPAGVGGMELELNGTTHVVYNPDTTSPYPSHTISSIISSLNGLIGSSSALFTFDGTRFSLIVKNMGFKINEPAVGTYGSAKRMLNRLFNREDAETWIVGQTIGFNTMKTGNPIVSPISGVYPIPAPATDLTISAITATSFTVGWTATAGLKYYVRVQGPSVDFSRLVDTSPLTLGTSDGLTTGDTYTITVVATSPYEISTSNPTDSVVMAAPMPPLTITSTDGYYTEVRVAWTPIVDPGYSVGIGFGPPGSPGVIYTDAALGEVVIGGRTQGTTYQMFAVLRAAGGDENTPQTFSITTSTIPVPILTSATPGQDTITVGADGQFLLSQVVNIVLNVYLEDSTPVGGDRLYGPTETSMVVSGLTPDVRYYIRGRYRLNDGTNGAFSSYVSALTFTPAPDLVNAGPTTPSSLRVSWTPNSLFQIRLDLIQISTGFVIDTVYESGSIGSYQFSGLLENTAYSVSATYSVEFGITPDGPTTTINISTISQPASFGPTQDGRTSTSHWNFFYIQYQPGINPNTVGVTIPAGSSYVGFKFNRFYMPILDNASFPGPPYSGRYGSLASIGGSGNGQVKIRVLDSSKTLIAETSNLKAYNFSGSEVLSVSNPNGIIPNTNTGSMDLTALWPYGYEFIFSSTVTMTEGMYILVESQANVSPVYGNEARLRWYVRGGGDPLIGVQNTAGDYSILNLTNNVLLCYFAKV